jgi:hypothetical protein
MSLLDRDIREFDDMYRVVVHNAADWEEQVIREFVKLHGHPPSMPDWRHIEVRCISEERRRWGTTRNAMTDVEWNAAPVVPTEPVVLPTQPLGASRLNRITGFAFRPRMYSYWSNAWVGSSGSTYVFAGAPGPQFWQIDRNGHITSLNGLLSDFGSETEGWYWDKYGCVYVPHGRRLYRVNPFTNARDVVAEVEEGFDIWQAHSSEDGQVHSFSLRKITSGAYPRIATVVMYHGRRLQFDARDALDESIITADGEWCIIQEGNYNRVINLRTGEERRITQEEGAVGHCDTGHGFVVGEDDQHGACVIWRFPQFTRTELFHTWNMGHVSVRGGRILVSDDKALWLVDLQGNVQHVVDHGVHVRDYDTQVRANLSPCGRRATWLGNGTLHVLEL